MFESLKRDLKEIQISKLSSGLNSSKSSKGFFQERLDRKKRSILQVISPVDHLSSNAGGSYNSILRQYRKLDISRNQVGFSRASP